jgi:hypothetical protein
MQCQKTKQMEGDA